MKYSDIWLKFKTLDFRIRRQHFIICVIILGEENEGFFFHFNGKKSIMFDLWDRAVTVTSG